MEADNVRAQMKATETVFVRGVGVIARDTLWFLGFSRSLWLDGAPAERRRLVWHWMLQLPTLVLLIVPAIAWRQLDPENWVGLLMTSAVPLIAIYATLLDIVRRLRPLNEGGLVGGTVLECWVTQGMVTIRTQVGDAVYDSHAPFWFGRQVARGDWVVVAIHPLDPRIAAVVNATPRALFTELRRRECAEFL